MATLQHRSAFNLRGSLPLGGSAIQSTDSGCDAEVLENIHEQVRQAANDYTWEANRIAIKAKLKYTCPKVGDAVRWDPSINGYNLSYAMFNTNRLTKNTWLKWLVLLNRSQLIAQVMGWILQTMIQKPMR